MRLNPLSFTYVIKLLTTLSTELSTDNMPVFYTFFRGVRPVRTPYGKRTGEQSSQTIIQYGLEGVRTPSKKGAIANTVHVCLLLSMISSYTHVINRSKNGASEVNYAEKLLQLATQSPKDKKDTGQVSLPIAAGFDLPDRGKILQTAYDVWQPVRDTLPEWIAYMSVRETHQNGDKTLGQAHRDAEQAYYAACQECPQFQYYKQVYQRLFTPKQQKEIDWWAEPSQGRTL